MSAPVALLRRAQVGLTCAPGMAHDLWGGSPLYTCQEEVRAKDKGVVMRRGLKEVRSKALARRTETAYEAYLSDENARQFEVRTLTRRQVRKCGG